MQTAMASHVSGRDSLQEFCTGWTKMLASFLLRETRLASDGGYRSFWGYRSSSVCIGEGTYWTSLKADFRDGQSFPGWGIVLRIEVSFGLRRLGIAAGKPEVVPRYLLLDEDKSGE